VERQNYLGIYLSKHTATVVCLGSNRDTKACFSVGLKDQQESDMTAGMSELANLVDEACAQRQLSFSEVAVALDCAMFMQHDIRSEFTDARQIAQTVKFDAEEVLSTDISEVAVAFKINSGRETGSELSVFTTQRQLLSDILLSLQTANIDPITVEPDITCLSRFILKKLPPSEDSYSLFAMLSPRRGYFLGLDKAQDARPLRTFLIDRTADRTRVLTREIPVTLALVETDQPISLRLLDSTGSIDCPYLHEKLGIRVSEVELAQTGSPDSDILAACDDHVAFAIAYGAALALFEKEPTLNFRSDFMPHQGKRARLQSTLKFLSVSVAVLMLALGTYVTSQLLRTNKDINSLRDKFRPQYFAAMKNQKPPREIKMAVKRLDSIKRRLQADGSPHDDESVTSKLILVLQAFNEGKTAEDTRLDIEKIHVAGKRVEIRGSTAGRKTEALFKSIRKRLDIINHTWGSEKGRDVFTADVALKTSS